MNGQEAVIVTIPSAVGENYEPQSKRQKVESDEETRMHFQTLIPSKDTDLGK